MPSSSTAQHVLMQLSAAGKSDKVPQKVGKEFVKADKKKAKKRKAKKKPQPKFY